MVDAPSILVCDSHQLYSDVIATFLRSLGWYVVSVAHDPAHAVAAVAGQSVDICLLGLEFPPGVAATGTMAAVLTASPATRVIILSSTSDPTVLAQAVEHGAAALVFKDEGIDRLVDVIACVTRDDGTPRVTSRLTNVRSHVQKLFDRLAALAQFEAVAPAKPEGHSWHRRRVAAEPKRRARGASWRARPSGS